MPNSLKEGRLQALTRQQLQAQATQIRHRRSAPPTPRRESRPPARSRRRRRGCRPASSLATIPTLGADRASAPPPRHRHRQSAAGRVINCPRSPGCTSRRSALIALAFMGVVGGVEVGWVLHAVPAGFGLHDDLARAHLALLAEDCDQGLVARAARHVGTIGEAFNNPPADPQPPAVASVVATRHPWLRRTVATPSARSGDGTPQAAQAYSSGA